MARAAFFPLWKRELGILNLELEETGKFANDLIRLGNGQIPHVDSKGSIELPFGQPSAITKWSPGSSLDWNMIFQNRQKVACGKGHFGSKEWHCRCSEPMPYWPHAWRVKDLPLQRHHWQGSGSTLPCWVPKFLEPCQPPPSHTKIGVPIMLLRNLNPPKLCNGTWLVVKKIASKCPWSHYNYGAIKRWRCLYTKNSSYPNRSSIPIEKATIPHQSLLCNVH